MYPYEVAIASDYGETNQMPGAADTAGPRDQPELTQPADQTPASLQRRLDNLPDGHPSSPYSEDGSRRAPALSLKDLELPTENTRDQGDTTPDTADPAGAWRDAMPALEAAWQDHLERWPQEGRAPIDRSADEPGSWRGDGGQYLSVEENTITERGLDRIS